MKKSDLQGIGLLIEEKLEPIKKTLGEYTDKLDALTLDMLDVQKKTDVLPDLHTMIKGTIEEFKGHEQRIEVLETAA